MRARSSRRPLVGKLASGAIVAFLLTVRPTDAAAEPKVSEPKAIESARTLFYRALALQDEGRWAEALELLERVAETRESAQVRFNIAFSQEHLGRLATAARGYERAIALAGTTAANVTRAARERLRRLSERVARLVLRPAQHGVFLFVDGAEVPNEDFGRALPLEVGDHTIRAEAAGYRPYRVSVTLPGGETRELRIELEPIHEQSPAAVAPPSEPSGPSRPAPPRSAPPPEPRRSNPSSLPYIAGGAAALSLATAAVFYALRADALATMRERCRDARCPEELRETDDRGRLFTTVANVALASGVGFAGVSAGFFIAELGDDDERSRSASVRANISTRF